MEVKIKETVLHHSSILKRKLPIFIMSLNKFFVAVKVNSFNKQKNNKNEKYFCILYNIIKSWDERSDYKWFKRQ